MPPPPPGQRSRCLCHPFFQLQRWHVCSPISPLDALESFKMAVLATYSASHLVLMPLFETFHLAGIFKLHQTTTTQVCSKANISGRAVVASVQPALMVTLSLCLRPGQFNSCCHCYRCCAKHIGSSVPGAWGRPQCIPPCSRHQNAISYENIEKRQLPGPTILQLVWIRGYQHTAQQPKKALVH
jgi:hypothetical protein